MKQEKFNNLIELIKNSAGHISVNSDIIITQLTGSKQTQAIY